MAKARKPKMTMARPAPERKAPTTGAMFSELKEASKGMKDEHKTFSHIMYVLFLISITIAAYFTLTSFRFLSEDVNFYGILGIVFLLWAFLFWEFGHRIHDA